MIRIIVIDDEKPSREALCTYLRDFCKNVEVVDECNSMKSAYNSIRKNRPQLVFLDIEMPNGNGFELLHLFGNLDFKVIFVTAYSEYAIKAFRYSAVDYLLKPVKISELIESVNRAAKLLELEDNTNLKTLIKNISQTGETIENLVIPNNKGFEVVRISDLIMCEADGYCTHFKLINGKKVTSSKNLKYYEELLDKHTFLRVHNSYMININYVKSYSHQGEIFLAAELNCPLGNTYKSTFVDTFSRMK